MFDVLYTVGLDSVVMSCEKNHQGAGHGGIQIVRRGKEARDESEEVGEEDEESQGSDQGQEFSAAGPDNVIQKLQYHFGEELEDVPQSQSVGWDDRLSRGMQGHLAKGQIRQQREDQEHKKSHRNLVRQAAKDRYIG
jgi:hypothetical protein